jgi:hypothetical protein
MTDHHDHTWDDDHGSHGVQPPPSDGDLRVWEFSTVRGAEPVPLHFFKGPGPMDVTRIRRRRVRLRDGTYESCNFEFRWFLEKVEGTSRSKALRRIYDVLLAPNSWTNAGVHWKRTINRAQAHIVVRVLPMANTVCGVGAAGCYSWGYERDGKPVAEMGVEYIDRPGPWAALVNMELLGHGTFRADDQYFAVHQPYPYGVMGDWKAMARAGYFPTEQEIADSITWLKGETPSDRIHWH